MKFKPFIFLCLETYFFSFMKLAVIKIYTIVPFSLPLMMNIKMAFFSVEKYKLQLSIVFLFLVAKNTIY